MGRPLFAAAIGILVCRLIVALAVIPPWQQPDEQLHVAITERWQHHFRNAVGYSDLERQADIIQSMVQHGWWRHYNSAAPAPPLPTRFIATDDSVRWTIGVLPESSDFAPLYYATVGGLLAIGPRRSVERDLQAMRIVSGFLAVLTLWAVWGAAREAAGDAAAGTIATLTALHPQFIVVSTAASTDAAILLAGAVIWRQAVRALLASNVGRSLVIAWVAALAAAAIDRMGIPLLAVPAVLTVYTAGSRAGLRFRTVAVVGAAIAMAMGTLLWVADAWWRILRVASWTTVVPVPRARTWAYLAEFTSTFFETWWYILGWARFHPPPWWTWIACALSVMSAAGLVLLLRRGRDNALRRVVIAALAVLAVQLAAVYWAYLRIAHMPQGRYLFPVFAPSMLLLWLGIRALVSPSSPDAAVDLTWRVRAAAVAVVLIFAVLEAASTLLVAVRVYAY